MGVIIKLLVSLGLSRWVGWAAFESLLSRMVISRVAISAWVKAYIISPSGAATIGLVGWDVFHSSALDEIGTIMGDRPNSFAKADLLEWAGRLGVKQLNSRFGTNFSSVYPPAQFVEEFKGEFLTQLVNGGGSLIPRNAALDFANETVRRFHLSHNVSTVGAKYGSRDTKERRANRARQNKYRKSHSRFQVWNSPDTFDLIVSAKSRLLLIRAGQKAARERAAAKKKAEYWVRRKAMRAARGV